MRLSVDIGCTLYLRSEDLVVQKLVTTFSERQWKEETRCETSCFRNRWWSLKSGPELLEIGCGAAPSPTPPFSLPQLLKYGSWTSWSQKTNCYFTDTTSSSFSLLEDHWIRTKKRCQVLNLELLIGGYLIGHANPSTSHYLTTSWKSGNQSGSSSNIDLEQWLYNCGSWFLANLILRAASVFDWRKGWWELWEWSTLMELDSVQFESGGEIDGMITLIIRGKRPTLRKGKRSQLSSEFNQFGKIFWFSFNRWLVGNSRTSAGGGTLLQNFLNTVMQSIDGRIIPDDSDKINWSWTSKKNEDWIWLYSPKNGISRAVGAATK